MNALSQVFRKLLLLFRRNRFRSDLDEEMAFHREQAEQGFIAAGMPPAEARRAGIRQFGNVTRLKERSNEVVGFTAETVVQDLRFGLRQLRRNPGFATTAMVILALGIGASVAIFVFVDAALIKPLPYPNPTRLVAVNESTALFPRNNISYPDYIDWKRLNTVFSSMDVYTAHRFEFNTPSGTKSVHGLSVSAGFFETLGIRPLLGRDFRPGEDAVGASPVVILRYGAWQRRFGGRADVIGQTINLSGMAYTVVGVLPRDFEFAPRDIAEFFEPLRPSGECEKRRSCHNLDGVGRLKDGVTVFSASAQMEAIAQQLEKQYPDSNRGQGASIVPLSKAIVGDIKPILLVLLGGAGLLLLIACVNVSSLMLVRAESRRHEIAVRGALGASRLRLSRQFVTEALMLAASGSALGMGLAYAGMKGLTALISKDWMAGMPFLRGLGLNPRVLAFAACLAVLAGTLFALAPILRFRLSNMRDGLMENSRGSAGALWRRMGANLVVVELATAVVLLAGAGLLAKSLYRLLHEDLGFNPAHLATANVSLPYSVFSTDAKQIAFEHALLERASTMPGVQSAALTSVLPVSCNCNTDWVRFVGKPYNGIHNEVNEREVSTGLFQTLQVKLKSGRFFNDSDDASKPKVVIVNQAFAEKYFPGEDPIGKKLGDTALTPASIREIVGVVENFKDGGLDEDEWPAEYEPLDQYPGGYYSLVLRTSQNASAILPELASMVQAVNPSVSVDWERTMSELIDDSQAAYIHRFAAYLVGCFAAVALVMGVVGLYGVIAYSVSQRTREIGVRMALGAQRGSVYRLVLGEASRLIGVGVSAGIAGSVGAATLMGKLLFGVHPWDAETLIAVAATLVLASLAASFVPARRAASINPTDALRTE
jgi:macrolide transport system ATP-binding/permease protein